MPEQLIGTNGDIIDIAKARHSAKAYDPARKISAENVEKIKDLLRFSPSSTNAQPWHFILASTEEGKARVAKSTEELYPFNRNSIVNASHVVVFACRETIEDEFLLQVLEQEEKDGRYAGDPETFKPQAHAGRSMFVDMHRKGTGDVPEWAGKQVYLNIGQFLLGVAALGIDATPMEGIDTAVLDEEFGLREKGFRSLAVVPLGYHDPEADFNAALPKSRLPFSEILTEV